MCMFQQGPSSYLTQEFLFTNRDKYAQAEKSRRVDRAIFADLRLLSERKLLALEHLKVQLRFGHKIRAVNLTAISSALPT